MDSKPFTREEEGRFKEKLLRLLKEKSYREGDFTLASGKKSSFYLDVKETALSPEGAYLIGELAVNLLVKQNLHPYAAGGMTLGADPLATAVSLAAFRRGLNIPAFIVRKQPKSHGTLAWVEGAKSYPKGAELLLLEDVVTTGGSSLTAVEKLEESGFKVKHLITVVDREEGGAVVIEKRGIAFFSLCTLGEIRNA